MSVYKLNITKTSQPHRMAMLLRKKKIKRGDKVNLVSTEKLSDASMMWMLIIFFVALGFFFDKKKRGESQRILDDLFRDYKSPAELESRIEEEYGIQVEVNTDEQSKEEDEWRKFAGATFLKGYSDSEPEYTEADVKELNPEYKKWKKAK